MYYLLKYTNLETKIVSNCVNIHHKQLILSNYCINNMIRLVENREKINELNVLENELFCYPINNKFVIINASYHVPNALFNSYSEKYDMGYFEFQFYVSGSLPISQMKMIKVQSEEEKKKHLEAYGMVRSNDT
jgi:hypothetical protein